MNVQDVIALVSLLLAIQALFTVFHFWLHEQYKKAQNKELEDIVRNAFLLDEIHKALSESLVENVSTMRFYSSLLARLLRANCDKAICDKVSDEFSNYDDRMMKRLQDLMLFSQDGVRRQSAIRQLSQAYGDMLSYEIMVRLQKHENGGDPVLSGGILALRRRLDSALAKAEE